MEEHVGRLQAERPADAVGRGGDHRLYAGLHAERNRAVHTGTGPRNTGPRVQNVPYSLTWRGGDQNLSRAVPKPKRRFRF